METGSKTTDLVYIALAAVLIAVCSWISLPMAVPFTLQTFAVFCVLELLGGRRGTIAVCVYILLGAVGLPVFSGFTGGIGKLLGTTGGYIIGFAVSSLIFWAIEVICGKSPAVRIVSLILGLLACYAFGTAWFMYVYAKDTGPIALGTALGWCVIPFIIPDLVKLALAHLISVRISRSVKIR